MNDYLLRYAIDNVWCNLGQDRQFVYQLRQLTPRYGTRRYYTVDAQKYVLPYESERDWFHVYQIGQVVPSHLALPKVYNQWMSLENLAIHNKMLGEVYVDSGIQFSRAQTWVLLTSNQNLLVAVKILPLFPDLDEQQPYLHFYQNAFFHSKRSDQSDRNFIEAYSIRPNTTAELRQFQVRMQDLLAEKGGFPMCWVNGRLVQEISLVTAGPGDYCEWVLDSSIYRVEEYQLSGTPTFTSTLDTANKYLIHMPKAKAVSTIEFHDDIAVFLCKNNNALQRYSGVHYHHNDGKWMRQLTHRDWSIPVGRVQSLIASHPEDPRVGTDPRWQSDKWTTADPMYIRMFHRRSGNERPIVAESSRIQELYRLSDTDIIRAMTGADSMPLWHAANLEKAAYVRFMSADPNVIYPIAFQDPSKTNQNKRDAQNFAGDVFGYHESAHLLANNPAKVYTDQSSRVADLAYVYWENATVFEYDATGVLLEWHHHTGGSRYYVHNASCALVEAITGVGSTDLEGVYGVTDTPLPDGYEFRVYVNRVWGGMPTGEWQDITDLPNRHDWGYLDETGTVPVWRWLVPATEWQGLIRRSNRFFLDSRRFNKSDGMIRFSFRHVSMSSGQETEELMDVPFGQLDVFLADENGENGRPLIEGLDYVIIPGKTFQETQVVLNNLEYLNDVNTVIYRGHGFCSPQLTMYQPTEFGFVEYGVLSGNSIYDVHTHKMQRIIVDGHYRSFEDVKFDEDYSDLIIADERNGSPYQIQTPQVTFRDVYDPDGAARVADDIKDKQVSDYMTEYFPSRPRPNSDKIERSYYVYSAYANKILNDLIAGTLKPPIVNGFYTDMDIANAVAKYDWLKPFDMCNREYNKNHVIIYPHWHATAQGLDIQQYDFFVRVLKLGLREVPDLSHSIYITRT
jgi:hypothetical protein